MANWRFHPATTTRT